MRHTSILSTLVLVLVSLYACTKPEITVSWGGLEVDNLAAKREVNVYSSKDWKATVSDSWIRVSPAFGGKGDTKVVVSIDYNAEPDERQSIITFSSEGIAQEITIIQGQNDQIEVEEESISVPQAGGGVKISVNSNVGYSIVNNNDWIKLIDTKGLSSSVIEVFVDENLSYSPREGIIELVSSKCSQTVKITQAQLDMIQVEPLSIEAKSRGERLSIPVSHNVDFSVSLIDSPSWIHLASEVTSESTSFDIVVDQNIGETRVGYISVGNSSISNTIELIQHPMLVNQDQVVLVLNGVENYALACQCAESVSWHSSNTSVVEVDSLGVITAKSKGSVTVTATTSAGYTESCSVTVIGVLDAVSVSAQGGKISSTGNVTFTIVGRIMNPYNLPIKINSIWLLDDRNTLLDIKGPSATSPYAFSFGPFTLVNTKFDTYLMNKISKYWVRVQFVVNGVDYDKDVYVNGHNWGG